MGLMFEPSEIFRIAVRIEENGERFYRELARKFRKPAVTRFFLRLAADEVRHREFYAAILAQLQPVELEEEYVGQYFDHLQSYADEILFSRDEAKRKHREVRSLKGALDAAIRAEMDAILYYQEIKALVPAGGKARIDEILEEERRHLLRLSQMKAGGIEAVPQTTLLDTPTHPPAPSPETPAKM